MLVATIVLSITGCMDRRQGATASRHPKDTLYTEQRAMEAYAYAHINTHPFAHGTDKE